ncbi:SGNH/GDSL hydrolase family protein [uncultured Friedmanniella sp.]|uniref:SGNH/GDSL hydrolase family protein n=1 Tax=uncultured Friedmanniella sp. TaxID=335381 RepID=UPI0035CA8A17
MCALALLLTACSPTSSATTTTPTPAPSPDRSSIPTPAASGSAASRLRVVALGDSVTSGSHCDCTPFPELYGRGLTARARIPTTVTNDGVPGETSADLEHELAVDASLDRSVAAADVVLVTIGANDYGDQYSELTDGRCTDDGRPLACVQHALDQTGTAVTAVLRRVQQLRDGRPTTVLVTGYWNVFEDGDVASRKFSVLGLAATDRLTVAVNAKIKAAAVATGDLYVDLYAPFKGESAKRDPTPLLAVDGDHPDAAGHRVIARALLAASPAH